MSWGWILSPIGPIPLPIIRPENFSRILEHIFSFLQDMVQVVRNFFKGKFDLSHILLDILKLVNELGADERYFADFANGDINDRFKVVNTFKPMANSKLEKEANLVYGRKTFYQRKASFVYETEVVEFSGTRDNPFELKGIYFATDIAKVKGYFTGKGMIVAKNKLIIADSIYKINRNDSITIISLENIVVQKNAYVQASVVAWKNVLSANTSNSSAIKLAIKGNLVMHAPENWVATRRPRISVVYDANLRNQPKGFTGFLKPWDKNVISVMEGYSSYVYHKGTKNEVSNFQGDEETITQNETEGL
jgi:hypothetical protein